MKYFKNLELARIYHVSEKSVRNWIEATRAGRLNLELFEKEGRSFISNTDSNQRIVEQLVAKGQKYKNSRGQKTVKPTPEFYKLYSKKQILDIIANIDIHREIPLQYSYFDGGSEYWDKFTQRLLEESGPNVLKSTIELLRLDRGYIDMLLKDFKDVNVIDLGVGNGLSVRETIAHLHNKKLLKRYTGIDLSREMLDLAKHNIDEWFDGQVTFEPTIRDISYDRFEDLTEPLSDSRAPTANVILLLGGTLTNLRTPNHALEVINSSMGKNDLLIYAKKLDTEKSRRYFDFNLEYKQHLAPNHKLILDYLNIDESLYEIEQLFDQERKERLVRVRVKVDLSINIEIESFQRQVQLKKGEPILVWRAKHQTALEVINQFDSHGFNLLHATKSPDQEYLLTISKIKTDA
ncbi:MAG TPA: L-histidine N(alpha)-methyltransferase [Candidatus Saccharimonadales bacterium]|nr:L-histidine N(alpha)-methyltransferase [Candidatus Saccharimonadales bacterium]